MAIDGTKIFANASKHSAVSHGHAEKTLHTLDQEIVPELLAKADQADATPPARRPDYSREVQRRQARSAKPNSSARRPKWKRASDARFQAEQAEHEAKLARRSEAAVSGRPPRGRAPQAPDPAPQSKDQVNFTDPESRIMKTKDGFLFSAPFFYPTPDSEIYKPDKLLEFPDEGSDRPAARRVDQCYMASATPPPAIAAGPAFFSTLATVAIFKTAR